MRFDMIVTQPDWKDRLLADIFPSGEKAPAMPKDSRKARHPLACDHCETVDTSTVYPTCRRCGAGVCPKCRITTLDDADAPAWSTVCRLCFAASQAEARQVPDDSVLGKFLRETWWLSPEDRDRLLAMFAGGPGDPGTLVRVQRMAAQYAASSHRDANHALGERLDWLENWCQEQLEIAMDGSKPLTSALLSEGE